MQQHSYTDDEKGATEMVNAPGSTIEKKKTLFKKCEPAIAIAVYCISSISTTVLNKYIISDLNFGLNCLLLVSQCFCTAFLLLLLRAAGFLNFRVIKSHELLKWLPVSLLLSAMIFTGTKVLEHCSISLVTVFKNTSILLVALGDWLLYGRKISPLCFTSFVVIVLSSLIGIYGDPDCSSRGVLWLLLNVFSFAAYILSLKGIARNISFSNLDAVFNNNLIMSVVFALASPFVDNWSALLNGHGSGILHPEKVTFSVFLSSVSAFVISTGTVWVVRTTSPTTFSFVSVLNKLPVSFSGVIFLKSETAMTAYKILSIVLSFVAGVLYSYSGYISRRKRKPNY